MSFFIEEKDILYMCWEMFTDAYSYVVYTVYKFEESAFVRLIYIIVETQHLRQYRAMRDHL